jgi:hypothetical protein
MAKAQDGARLISSRTDATGEAAQGDQAISDDNLTAPSVPRMDRRRSLHMITVLIVDDMPQVRQMVRFTVQDHQHRVLEARDGVEGWALVTAERPDLQEELLAAIDRVLQPSADQE